MSAFSNEFLGILPHPLSFLHPSTVLLEVTALSLHLCLAVHTKCLEIETEACPAVSINSVLLGGLRLL